MENTQFDNLIIQLSSDNVKVEYSKDALPFPQNILSINCQTPERLFNYFINTTNTGLNDEFIAKCIRERERVGKQL